MAEPGRGRVDRDDPGTGELLRRAVGLSRAPGRRLLGITGAPGSGKSTLARAVVEHVGASAQNVPMDGFHLPTSELAALGRTERKGAPDTFDVQGYVALLLRLRTADGDVRAPDYSREVEEPVAESLLVRSSISLVVTEGNYLLLHDHGWAAVRGLLDEVWFVETDEAQRVEQLVARHVRFGKTPQAARRWVLGSDQANAELVAATRADADVVVRLGDGRAAVRRGGDGPTLSP